MALPDNTRPFQTRFSFGATSAIMTNLGLICGLDAGSNPKRAIIGSILVIAVADNISDSLGIHIFQESERVGEREVWFSTFTNYATRLLVSLTFILLVALLPMKAAVVGSVLWGMSLLTVMSYWIARDRGESALATILEHVLIAAAVIAASHFVGELLSHRF